MFFWEVVMTDLLSLGEAAALARVSKQTVLRAAGRGELRVLRLGPRVVRIPRPDLMRWLWGADWERVTGELP